MTEQNSANLVQTHEDIEEIPEGVAVSNSLGSEEPDDGDIEPEDYSDVQIDPETGEVTN